MKAINIEMLEVKPMVAQEARELGYKVPDVLYSTDMGYEITYPDGSKTWCLKEELDSTYYLLSENNDGTKILKEDVENFITDVDVTTVGEKTTIVNAHTRSGFDIVRHSSCVDPKNYNEELGKQYAMEEVVNNLWGHLGFVLQWAKFGIDKVIINNYPSHIQRVIIEYKELIERSNKLAKFINANELFKILAWEEQEDMKNQLTHMYEYSQYLASRLMRAGVDYTKLN